jgi:hypothetical protein
LAVVHLFIAFFRIAGAAKGLGVPDETGASLDNWFNMIHREVLKRKFNITSEAMEIIELAKVVPFSGGVRAARLGFAGTANIFSFPLILLVLFGLLILALGLLPNLLALFRLSILPLGLLVLFGAIVLLALFGAIVLLAAYFALTLESISCLPVPMKSLSRFDLITLTTRLHHFAVSLFFSISKLYSGQGGNLN